MNILWAILLGMIQGFTEFLPISSSGHLVILQSLIPSFSQPGVLFDVILHLGTMFAVLVFFRKTLLESIKKYFLLFVIGSIPAALVGYFFQDQLEAFFGNVKLVAVALILTSLFNFLTDKLKTSGVEIDGKKSLFIGALQAFAIIPGVSRSGLTIFAGVLTGIDKKKAAEFSFLLSLPAIAGANLLQFISYGTKSIEDPIYYIFGFMSAFVSGFIAIGIVLKTLHKKQFKYFGFYCLIVGVLVLILS